MSSLAFDTRDLDSMLLSLPGTDVPPSPSQAYEAARDEMLRFGNIDYQERNRYEVVQNALDAFAEVSGRTLFNPEEIQKDQTAQRSAAYARVRAEISAAGGAFPSDDEIDAQAGQRGRAARERYLALEARREAGGGSSAAWWAGMGGTVVGGLADPLNLLTMPFGPAARAGIMGAAAVTGAIGGATQVANEVMNFEARRRIDERYTAADAAGNVAGAAIGGAVIGGGIKAIGKMIGATVDALRARGDREALDAANVLEREAISRESVPLQDNADVEARHIAALDKAAEDIDAGRPVDVQDIAPRIDKPLQGQMGAVYTAAGREVDVEYRVVESDAIIGSNFEDGQVNPVYPSELQPRDRTRPGEIAQVQEIAGRPNPALLGRSSNAENGAPIVGPDDMVVESGNGRVMGLRRAYAAGRATEYRAMVESQFPEAARMKAPIMVAVRRTPLSAEDRIAFAREANQSGVARMSPAQRATSDAQALDDMLLELHRGGGVELAANRDFVRAFMEKLPAAERTDLIDADGALSPEGARRLNAALLARAYGDRALLEKYLEDQSPDMVAAGRALLDAAGEWAKLRAAARAGDIPPGMDVTPQLISALRLIERARREGEHVADALAQLGMFGDDLGAEGRLLVRMFYRDDTMNRLAGRESLADRLRGFANEAMKNKETLFTSPRSASDILTGGEPPPAPPPPPPPRDIAAARTAEELAGSPELRQALEAEVDRVMAARMIEGKELKLAEFDAEGRLVERDAADALADIDREIRMAAELAACAFGQAAT